MKRSTTLPVEVVPAQDLTQSPRNLSRKMIQGETYLHEKHDSISIANTVHDQCVEVQDVSAILDDHSNTEV